MVSTMSSRWSSVSAMGFPSVVAYSISRGRRCRVPEAMIVVLLCPDAPPVRPRRNRPVPRRHGIPFYHQQGTGIDRRGMDRPLRSPSIAPSGSPTPVRTFVHNRIISERVPSRPPSRCGRTTARGHLKAGSRPPSGHRPAGAPPPAGIAIERSARDSQVASENRIKPPVGRAGSVLHALAPGRESVPSASPVPARTTARPSQATLYRS